MANSSEDESEEELSLEEQLAENSIIWKHRLDSIISAYNKQFDGNEELGKVVELESDSEDYSLNDDVSETEIVDDILCRHVVDEVLQKQRSASGVTMATISELIPTDILPIINEFNDEPRPQNH